MPARSYACCYTQGRRERSSVHIIQGTGGEDHSVGRSSMLGSKVIQDILVELCK